MVHSGLSGVDFSVELEACCALRGPSLKIFPDLSEDILIGAAFGEFKADTPDTDFDPSGNLEQAQAEGADGGLLQARSRQDKDALVAFFYLGFAGLPVQLHQLGHNSFLGVEAVFGFVEDDALRAV